MRFPFVMIASVIGFALAWHIAACSMAAVADAKPLSQHKTGETIDVWIWCDTAEAMSSVVARDTEAGQDAAIERFKGLVDQKQCHWLPATMPTTGTLIDQVYAAYVKRIDPGGRERRILVEVWRAAIVGVADRPVYTTTFDVADET